MRETVLSAPVFVAQRCCLNPHPFVPPQERCCLNPHPFVPPQERCCLNAQVPAVPLEVLYRLILGSARHRLPPVYINRSRKQSLALHHECSIAVCQHGSNGREPLPHRMQQCCTSLSCALGNDPHLGHVLIQQPHDRSRHQRLADHVLDAGQDAHRLLRVEFQLGHHHFPCRSTCRPLKNAPVHPPFRPSF